MSQFTVLSPDVYQGTVTSAPQAWEFGKVNVQAKGLLSDPDLANNSIHVAICLETSFDGGTNWQSGPKAIWVGGSVDPFATPTTPPTYVPPNVLSGFGGSGSPPTHVRVRFDLPQIISVGAVLIFS